MDVRIEGSGPIRTVVLARPVVACEILLLGDSHGR
jgi:hypothetical protein